MLTSEQRSRDPVTAWCDDVVSDRVVAGLLTKCAAERHLRDLRDGPKRGLHWDLDAALHVINWYPTMLTITAGELAGRPFHLLPHHLFATGSLFGWKRANGRRRFRTLWQETGKGQAKALALDTPIPTPGGWTTMGALRDGDAVLDDAGRPCRVVRAHPVVTGQECYRVRFDDGAEIVANAGHLWRTEMRNSGNSGHGDATKGVPLAQRGAWRNGIRTTAEIAATLTYKNGKYQSANHSVALAGAVDLPETALPVHPYVLGAWLGDGDSDSARITCGDQDASAMTAIMAECDIILSRQNGHACRYGLRSGDRWGLRAENLSNRLRSLGLYGNKHIPAAYLRASRDQRLALLQGLMDTDGTIGADGQCCFGVTNRKIAEGTLEVAISLGLKATIGTERARLNGEDCGEVHRVRFYAPEELPVFRLARKLVRQKARHGRRRLSGERRIVACERIESVPVRCITVDSPSSMFLAGRQMVPTHNSPWMAATGLYMMRFAGVPRFEGYAVAGTESQSGIVLSDAAAMCRAMVPEQEQTLEEYAGLLLRGTGDLTWQIEWDGSDFGLGICKFRNVSAGKNISGPKPSLVMGDEIHEWDDENVLEMWSAAVAKMPGDPLMLLGTNTPAADQILATTQSDFYAAVAKGDVQDDSSLALICTCDEEDDPLNDETVWRKSLPALDITYASENIRDEVNKARELPGKQLTIKRLYFGIRVGVADCWIDLALWQSVLGKIDDEEIKGLPCWLGLDLSSRKDLTALAMVWRRPDGHLLARVEYWTPEATIKQRSIEDRTPYDQWAAQKHLVAVPGPTIPKSWPARRVRECAGEYDVRGLSYDPSQILDFEEAATDEGLRYWRFEGPDEPAGDGLMMIRHGQGFKGMDNPALLSMPTSVKALEEAILNHRITIEINPVTTACSLNMALQPGANPDQRVPNRRKARGRIDGMVALIEAVGAWEFDPCADPSGSIYDDPAAYSEAFGAPSAEATPERQAVPADDGSWSAVILADPSHPLFAEHKRRFDEWQEAESWRDD